MTHNTYSLPGLRRASWQFLTGKVATATLTFAILLLLVRLLPVAEYGAYVVLIAGTELGYAIAGLGLSWLAARYVPEYRLNAKGESIAKLCFRLVLWQVLALLILIAAVAAILPAYLDWAGLSQFQSAAWLALGVLMMEGLARFERDSLMGPLMMQGELRSSLLLRQSSFLAAIVSLDITGHGQLDAVIVAEFGAAFLGLVWAHFALNRHLSNLRNQSEKINWREPALRSQWQVALRMYSAQLIALAYSPQVLVNIVQRSLGTEASALFGFLRTLHEQISRHLPATLLFSIIRPKLMASYVSGGITELERNANLAGKLSLFALMPMIIIVLLAGDPLVALLSGGKFLDGGLFLFGLLVALVPASQRIVIESVAVAIDQVALCTWGAMAGLLVLPLVFVLLENGMGIWAPISAILFGHVLFNAVVLIGVARKPGYHPDWIGSSKLGISAFIAWLATIAISNLAPQQSLELIILTCILAIAAYLIAAWRLRPFAEGERQRINAMVGRRLFVW